MFWRGEREIRRSNVITKKWWNSLAMMVTTVIGLKLLGQCWWWRLKHEVFTLEGGYLHHSQTDVSGQACCWHWLQLLPMDFIWSCCPITQSFQCLFNLQWHCLWGIPPHYKYWTLVEDFAHLLWTESQPTVSRSSPALLRRVSQPFFPSLDNTSLAHSWNNFPIQGLNHCILLPPLLRDGRRKVLRTPDVRPPPPHQMLCSPAWLGFWSECPTVPTLALPSSLIYHLMAGR